MTQNYLINEIDKTTTSPSTDIDKLTDAHDAHRSNFSGISAPTSAIPYQVYADTTDKVYKQRNSANTAWNIVSSTTDTPVTSKTANYSAVLEDYAGLILVNASSAQVIITLPSAASVGNGWYVTIKKTDSSTNLVTIASSDNIDGITTISIANKNKAIGVRANGTTFSVFIDNTVANTTSSGNLVLLERYTVTSVSNLPIVGHITNLYNNYILKFDLKFSAGQNNVDLVFSSDNGATYIVTGYTYAHTIIDSTSATNLSSAANTSEHRVLANINGSATNASFAEVRFHHMSTTDRTVFNVVSTHTNNAGNLEHQSGGGRLDTGVITNALKIKMSGAALFSGTLEFFGTVI